MPEGAASGTVTLDALFKTAALAAQDATSVALTLLDDSDNVVSGFPVGAPDVTHIGFGHYQYIWHVPALQAPGTYRATWTGIGTTDNTQCVGYDLVLIQSPGFVTVPSTIEPSGPYVTPGLFPHLYLGSKIPAKPIELAAVLRRASSVVDGYCTVPLMPQRHDFRGGTITGERHTWRLPDGGPASSAAGSRRTYPYHWPILSVERFGIRVSNTAVALDIETSEIMIQNGERYLEVVSLIGSTFGLFNAITMPNVFLATPTADFDYTYGHRFRVTKDPAFPEDPAAPTVWRAGNQWWFVDGDNPVVVYVNDVIATTGFTYNPNEGTITFSSSLDPDVDVVEVTYTHRMPVEIRDATALIARYELSQSDLARKGLAGIESIRMAELEITQRREPRGSGVVTANNLDRLVPEAADLLSGLKFFRIA